MTYKPLIRWTLLLLLTFTLATLHVTAPQAQSASDRPVMAFYFPWWEYSDWTYDRMPDLPTPRYSGGEDETIKRHIQQADDAGIDALICTWYGPDETRLNSRCQRLQELVVASGRDLKVGIIPDQSAWPALRSVESLSNALAALQRDFISKPGYMTFQGKPVVFWFNPPSLGGVDTWGRLRDIADPNRQQFWFGGTDNFNYLDVYDVLYYFDISWETAPGRAMASYASRLDTYNQSRGAQKPFIATVMPGYDDLRLRNGHARDRANGDYYRGAWKTAIERNAAAVVLTSFNEFFEGSHIEPSENYGDLYLRLTRELSDQFRAQAGQAVPSTDCQFFPETNFQVCGRLLSYWRENGGLQVFGYPITAQRGENIEGQTLQVQDFERNRLELHPGNARPYDVLLGRLGDEILRRQGRDWQSFGKVDSAPSGCLYFPETRQSLCEPFLSYWRSQGLEFDGRPGYSISENIALFGLPLSEQQPELLSNGAVHTVQWFERTRFEHHPDNPNPYKVLLGLLGVEKRDS